MKYPRVSSLIRCVPFGPGIGLVLFVMILLVDAPVGRGGALLLELFAHGAVELFLKDRLDLDSLELGLEVIHVVGGRVAATASIGHVGPDVFELFAGCALYRISISFTCSNCSSLW
jgi:hypothetical protein